MRIGMFLDAGFPPDMRVENEAVSLIKAGHEVFLFCHKFDGNSPTKESYKGFTVVREETNKQFAKKGRGSINTIFDFYSGFWAKRIKKFVSEYNIEAIHVHDLYLLGAAYKANKGLNLPIVSDLHENYPEALKYYSFTNKFPGKYLISKKKWEKTEIEWVKKADKIITVIEEAVERYSNLGIDRNKINVVANYVDETSFLEDEFYDEIINRYDNKFVASYIGGFDIHRGLECTIKALPEIIKSIPDFKLVLVGRGRNMESLISMSKNLGVAEYVDFEGFQPPKKLPSYIKASNICLIPHLKTVHTDNTIPHKLFHYMLLGKPIIASDCAPIERIVKETECGAIFENNNSQDFAKQVLALWNRRNKFENIGQNGINAVKNKYNWENTAENLVELYKNL